MAPSSRYEEALERARKGMPMDEVFPELKESEDERIRKALIEVFKKKLERGYEWVEYGIPNRSVLDWLEKQIEQQPAEWSEEDERIMNNCIGYIKASCLDANDLYECIDWLKSLRPQSHWKPSEEQMEALRAAAYEPYKNRHKLLQELYIDLKKL